MQATAAGFRAGWALALLMLAGCAHRAALPPAASPSPAEPRFHTVCAGAESPAIQVIFLQGIVSPQDAVDYFPLLDRVGRELHVRFAIPQSDLPCRNNAAAFCWGTAEPASVAQVYHRVQISAASCFSPAQPVGLLGFSNGGYFVGRVMAQGHAPAPAWAAAIGSAGLAETINPASVSQAVPFYLQVGKRDLVRQNARQFADSLQAAHFNVRFDEYEGGHELAEAPLRALLQKVL